ncbi:MAG: 4Fe-4S binding protein [Deltaproteobacteria bacterium]|nr:4Fe-4S binding protein [Deltaproteobacteria bacterium]
MKKPVDAKKIYERLQARVAEEKTKKIDPIYGDLASRIAGVPPDHAAHLPAILAKLASLEQARIVAALPDPDLPDAAGRSLDVSDTFARKMGMEKQAVDRHIRELYEKGLLFPTKKGPSMARTYIQLHDAVLGNPKYDEALGKSFFDLWGSLDQPMEAPKPEEMQDRFIFRVIPRLNSIEDVEGVLPFEDLRTYLRENSPIALLPCGCKRSHTDRWCGVPEDSCINLGRTAQYNIDRGAAREITYDEAVEILEKFNKHPVVNVTLNQRDVNQLICNCHYCCCPAVRYVAKSRFVVEVNPEDCIACGKCDEICQFGAISMKHYPEFGEDRSAVDAEICRGCGCCVIACPSGARTMKVVRPPEYIPESLSIY